jgi:hypothetical protein
MKSNTNTKLLFCLAKISLPVFVFLFLSQICFAIDIFPENPSSYMQLFIQKIIKETFSDDSLDDSIFCSSGNCIESSIQIGSVLEKYEIPVKYREVSGTYKFEGISENISVFHHFLEVNDHGQVLVIDCTYRQFFVEELRHLLPVCFAAAHHHELKEFFQKHTSIILDDYFLNLKKVSPELVPQMIYGFGEIAQTIFDPLAALWEWN